MGIWNYPRVLMADIIAETAHVFGVPEGTIMGKSRIRENVRARFVCCYLGRGLTALSYPMIGRALGGRDHSTAIHGEQQAKLHMERDPEYDAYVDAVRIRLLNTRHRADQRRREALAIARERLRREQADVERLEREEAEAVRIAARDDMDEISEAVAAYAAAGGSFVEVHA